MTTPAPRLSVLLPCRDAATTLDEALASIFSQTFTDFEVVAVDDGSTDGSAERLEAWAQVETRLRLLRLPPRGLIEALNAGLAACRAPLIARMDADDRSHPERFAEQVRLLEADPGLAAAGCLVEAFPAAVVRPGLALYLAWLNGLTTPEAIAREIYVESPLVHPSVTMRSAWIERVGGYQEHGWPEDYDLWLRIHAAGGRFAKVPRMLFSWREHPGRLTHASARYAIESFLEAKVHYLLAGPLKGRGSILIWGAGIVGKRLSKRLLAQGAPVTAFIDIDPAKIGRTRRGLPVIAPQACLDLWQRSPDPILLAAVGARGVRPLVREQINGLGLVEGRDWWAVA
ncbi:MAG: glycosyltransferase [Chloroflexi bacterium]|nr:glycosyltransferase [Chloroflexota bacterium]